MLKQKYYTNRIPELDLLRGLAIIMVLFRHYPIIPGFRQCWIGVDIFFTLSGFLVAGLLIREYQAKGSVNIGRFLVRRGLKIYPSFYFFLFLTVGLAWILKLAGKPIFFPVLNIRKFLVETIYLQSLQGGLWWHTWSLAVEEHFYFLLAAIVFLLAAVSRKLNFVSRLFMISALFIPFCNILRFCVAENNPEFSYTLHYNNTFLRLDSLFFGVLIACIYYGYNHVIKKWSARIWYLMIITGTLMIVSWLIFYPLECLETAMLGYTVIYVGFGLVMLGLLGFRQHFDWTGNRSVKGNPAFRAILSIGRNSYNIYLWHAFVLETMILSAHSLFGLSLFDPMTIHFFVIYLFASIVLGSIATRLLEIPILKWRDHKYKAASKITG